MNVILTILIIVCNICLIVSSTTANDNYYIGAVLEYSPLQYHYNDSEETPIKYMLSNVKQYEGYIKIAKEQGAQIMVFPEYGLIGGAFATRDDILPYLEVIPDPMKSSIPIIPCNNSEYSNRTVLQTLSCMAIENTITIVVDMGDVQYCTNTTTSDDCPSDGRFQYNTQVAISSNGQLLAKYHKSHLYGEPFFNPSVPADPVVFTSDFGVTFGMFICFDILFKEPQSTLVQKYGIKNLVYSTEWVNVNYAYAREVQQSWSKINGANVLAANIGVMNQISGSGIYSNGNLINTWVNPTTQPQTKLLVGKLPKDPENSKFERNIQVQVNDQQPQPQSIDYIKSMWGSPTSINVTVVPFSIKANQVDQVITSENNGLVCTFQYSTGSQIDSTRLYSLISFSGNFNDFFNSQLCCASICSSNDPQSCFDIVFDSSSTFTSVSLNADPIDQGYHIFPTFTTYPLIDNYLSDYNYGDQTFTVDNIEQYFVGMSLFSIQWYNSSSSTSN